jgi:methionine-gamma-lyase
MNYLFEKIAQQMIDRLEIVHYAVSLGHHRSLIFWMDTQGLMDSSFRLSGTQLESYRSYAGDGVFRMSVGLEDPEDLIRDLSGALSKVCIIAQTLRRYPYHLN